MDGLIRSVAPMNRNDFLIKLFIAVTAAGMINHCYDIFFVPTEDRLPAASNFLRACFTAIPMCSAALFLLSHFHALQTQLYAQSITDPLTLMRNRRWFMDKATRMHTTNLTLILLDLDHFKKVNDTYGHDVGDICLRVMADHVRDSLRADDICARIGGEEFAVLLADADRNQVHEIALKICLGTTFQPKSDVAWRITASAGVAFAGDDTVLSDAIRQADKALYQAKKNGRSRYEWSTTGEEDVSNDKVALLPVAAVGL